MSKEFWAHSGADAPHFLEAHLAAVGERAALNAKGFGPTWAYLAGLWHDLGKYRPGFQTYIRQTADAHIEGKLPSHSDKSHSTAGAIHALETLRRRFGATGERAARLLAYVIAGHHAGLADWTAGLDTRLLGTGAPDSQREYTEALDACQAAAPHILALPASFELDSALRSIPGVLSGAEGVNPLA